MTAAVSLRVARVRTPHTAWTLGPALWLALVNGGGMLLILVAWWGSSGSVRLPNQVAWLNVGVLGVVTAGAGNVTWLLAGRRAIAERRGAMQARIAALAPAVAAPDVAAAADERLVSRAGMTRYHRKECPLVAGKTVAGATLARHHKAGRHPCGVCEP